MLKSYFAAAAALCLCAPAGAESYVFENAGAQLAVFTPELAPGGYVFLLEFDSPVTLLTWDLAYVVYYDDYCSPQPPLNPNVFKCGGNDYDNQIEFKQTGDTSFRAEITLQPAREIFYVPGDFLYKTLYRADHFRGGYIDAMFDPAPHKVRLVISSIPEPASWAMMLLGFGMVGVSRSRRTAHLKAIEV